MNLSPLNFSGLIANSRPVDGVEAPTEPRAKPECRWHCPECDADYSTEEDAEECCPDDDHPEQPAALASGPAASRCPCCAEQCLDVRGAADCCLWKDIGPAERWGIASVVERGLSWVQALGLDA